MGARPIAVLDALRFGDPADARTRHLVDGVVRGVGGYGNCVGVPTVGGELVFDPSYAGNPLVNVMAIGLLEERLLTLAAAPGPGNLVVLYGSATGRDGIGGASVLASATFTDDDPSKRPSVQVGDPFAEKLLIEASLELIERGLVEGLQDLGAGGITCATSETADRAGTGIVVDLDAIPRREPGLEPFEVMISESQERMCAAVLPERWAAVREVCERWGLPGRDHRPGHGRRRHHGRDRRPGPRWPPRAGRPGTGAHPGPCPDQRRDRPPSDRGRPDASPRRAGAGCARTRSAIASRSAGWIPGAVLLALLGSANLASRHAVFHQYDSTVGADTVAGPGRGAAVLRVKGTTKALVATTDGNAAVGAFDPWLGAALAVAEATRNVSITGARPLGVTNCLNYGDPTRPEAFWQLSEGVRGLADACLALGIPVTGGNVSLYNESADRADRADRGDRGRRAARRRRDPRRSGIQPRPRRDPRRRRGGARASPAPPTPISPGTPRRTTRPRSISPARRRSRRSSARRSRRGLVASAQDVSGGGLGVALAECAMWGGLGASVRVPVAHSPAVDLFGESPSRLVLSCRPRYAAALALLARQHGLPVETIGSVGGDRLVIELVMAGATGNVEDRGGSVADALEVPLRDLRHAWDHGLARALGWEG